MLGAGFPGLSPRSVGANKLQSLGLTSRLKTGRAFRLTIALVADCALAANVRSFGFCSPHGAVDIKDMHQSENIGATLEIKATSQEVEEDGGSSFLEDS